MKILAIFGVAVLLMAVNGQCQDDTCLMDQRGWPRANVRVEYTAAAVDIPLRDFRERWLVPSERQEMLKQLRDKGLVPETVCAAELLRKTKETLFAA